jgi:tyrosine-protein kinase Etk/Wzc
MQLLNRQQELNIAKSSAIGNVRIIDNAVAQPKPVKPFISWYYFGGMVSIGLVLLRVFLRRGIESPEQLEELGIMFMPASLFRKHLRKKYSDS